ncbi:hypothetical protein BaRGS_00036531, partial [Batillaria attramentaria]
EHDDRVGVAPYQWRGRGRGRARGRVHATEQENPEPRPGVVSSSHPPPLQQTTHADQFADSDHLEEDDKTQGPTTAATREEGKDGQHCSGYSNKHDGLSAGAKLEPTDVDFLLTLPDCPKVFGLGSRGCDPNVAWCGARVGGHFWFLVLLDLFISYPQHWMKTKLVCQRTMNLKKKP